MKGTPLEDAKISLGGTASTFKDMADGSKYDLVIAGIASICLIFADHAADHQEPRRRAGDRRHRGALPRCVVRASRCSIWQHILGIELHWMVLAMAVIILLAVGSDYNLLLVSRFKEEIPGGLKTGIIRAMGGTGSVVTAAGLGVRAHDVLDGGQRSARDRPDGHHHRARAAVRHAGRTVVHDTVHRHTARPVVLVADERA